MSHYILVDVNVSYHNSTHSVAIVIFAIYLQKVTICITVEMQKAHPYGCAFVLVYL